MISFKQLLKESLRKPREIGLFKSETSHIQNVDARDQAWQGTLNKHFDRYGFKPLGAGKYGTVFGKTGYPYIIKVFMRDTAYLKWLNFCKQNQNNPYVPKIKGKVIKLGNLFMAVRLEKLTRGGNPDDIYTADDRGDKHATQVVDFLEANNKLMDLHAGNVMLRGKQLVIIDPFYNFFRSGSFSIDPNDVSKFKDIL